MGTRLDRYLLLEWSKIFLLILGATYGLVLLQEFYDSFRDFLDYQAPIAVILYYYAVLSPSFLALILPISMLLSLLYALGGLHRNNEFVAMQTAGLGVYRITRTLWAAGVLFAALLLWGNARIIPWSVEQSRLVLDTVVLRYQARTVSEAEVGMVYNLGFYNRGEGRVWMINRFSTYSFRAFGVTVSIVDASMREETRYMASEAFFDDVDGVWVLLRGRIMEFDPEVGELRSTRPFDQVILTEFEDDPRLMLLLAKRPRDLSFHELQAVLRVLGEEDITNLAAYQVRYHSILASPLICLIVVGLAIPYAVRGVRVNPVIGVSKSLGLFAFFFFLSTVGRISGEQEWLPAVWAAWLPYLLMGGWAVWQMRKV